MLSQRAHHWRGLLRAVKRARPTHLPAHVLTRAVAEVPIHIAGFPDWEIRAVRVEAEGPSLIELVDGQLQAGTARSSRAEG